MVGSSYTANGFQEESNSEVNLPLILGITIPVVVVFVVVVIVIVIKLRAPKNNVHDKEVVKVEEEIREPKNYEQVENTASHLKVDKKN